MEGRAMIAEILIGLAILIIFSLFVAVWLIPIIICLGTIFPEAFNKAEELEFVDESGLSDEERARLQFREDEAEEEVDDILMWENEI